VYALHRDLLAIRRKDPVIRAAGTVRIDGAVLSPSLFVLRYASGDADDRLLVINLGVEASLALVPEPLLAPPFEGEWYVLWHSESTAYGGSGRAPFVPEDGWHVPGESALLLASRRRDPSAAQKPKRRAGGTPAAGQRRRTDGQTDG